MEPSEILKILTSLQSYLVQIKETMQLRTVLFSILFTSWLNNIKLVTVILQVEQMDITEKLYIASLRL